MAHPLWENMTTTRFAPSPTGLLHMGHAASALYAYEKAKATSGRFILRIEDIDQSRSRDHFIDDIYRDLEWLGLEWEAPVWKQSDRWDLYHNFLHILEDGGLIYPCFCTRAQIKAEIENSPSAPHGPDGILYPGTCRDLSDAERKRRIDAGESHAWRLDIEKAASFTGPLSFEDENHGSIDIDPASCGDIVIARKDIPTSYHLAATVDDALQYVSLVTRGNDLLHATHIHRLLQALYGFPVPRYSHHPLLLDEEGKRFAKRDQSVTLKSLRESGKSPIDLRQEIIELGFPLTP